MKLSATVKGTVSMARSKPRKKKSQMRLPSMNAADRWSKLDVCFHRNRSAQHGWLHASSTIRVSAGERERILKVQRRCHRRAAARRQATIRCPRRPSCAWGV
jgi:hypothetical protein